MEKYGIELVEFDNGTFGIREYEKNSRVKNEPSSVQIIDNVDTLDIELREKLNKLYEKYEC